MIRVRGARQHNLVGVDLDLEPGQVIVFAGRSGSGKSSMAFDTLHAEGQRRYLDALSLRARRGLPQLPRPDADQILGVPPSVALSQHGERPGGGSTVGTFAELDPPLRVLFARAGVQHDPVTGEPVVPVTHDQIVGHLLALPAGSRLHVEAPVRVSEGGAGLLDEVVRAGFSRVRLGGEVRGVEEIRPDASLAGLRVVVDRIKVSSERQDRLHDAVRTASAVGHGTVVAVWDEGERVFLDRPWSESLGVVLPDLRPTRFRRLGPDPCEACEGRGCGVCGGTGVGAATRAVRLFGHTWPELQGMPVDALTALAEGWPRDAVSGPLIDELVPRLTRIQRLGIGHVTVGRGADALSDGEAQRLRLARQVAVGLSGVLMVLDEPTAHLDDAGVAVVGGLLQELAAQGNTVIAVEHHPAVIAAADRVVEFGPGAGVAGGQVVYDGRPAGLLDADTPTGRALRGDVVLAPPGGRSQASIEGWGPGGVSIARGALTALVGPSGTGKSSALARLAEAVMAGGVAGAEGISRVVLVDADAAARSRRSAPATYLGLWDVMRDLYASTSEAQVRGLSASHFSLHVRGGRCEACKGLGAVRVEMELLADVLVPCDVCEGRRFARDVLEVRWKGLSPGDVLELTGDEARARLAGHPRLEEALRALHEVGLGYLRLGQPTDTLSGGEVRRLKLARELVRAFRLGGEDALYLLDDPTVGLHPEDAAELHRLLSSLVRAGATVVVATHHLPLIAGCDAVVRLAAAG